MQLYDCQVRLGGSAMNEVAKTGITAPELLILRRVHGDDSVVKVRAAGKTNAIQHVQERVRLGKFYGDAVVLEMFGAGHNSLPTKVDGLEEGGKPAVAGKVDFDDIAA